MCVNQTNYTDSSNVCSLFSPLIFFDGCVIPVNMSALSSLLLDLTYDAIYKSWFGLVLLTGDGCD